MIDLKNITLFMLDGVDPNLCVKALRISMRGINFGSVKLVTLLAPDNSDGIEVTIIDRMNQPLSNDFMISRLNEYIDTDFVLVQHTDGFVINPELWTDEFLKYDYIGSPWLWPEHKAALPLKYQEDFNPVGNGGFSLRSKRFIKKSSYFSCTLPEDMYLCNLYKNYFIDAGMTYAPVDIALKFAQDPVPNWTSTFGFHGDRSAIHSL